MFGTERLQSMLESERTETIDTLLHHVEQRVATFRGSAEPFDDATLMALRIS
jgi:serine phosphatase RsbU (regulator of sigma subunit)